MIPLAPALVALSLLAALEPKRPPAPPLREDGQPGLVVSRLPREQQPRYQLFATKCGRCHGLERALDSGFTAAEWKKYLKRMDRHSGAGITGSQSTEIREFLDFWARRSERR